MLKYLLMAVLSISSIVNAGVAGDTIVQTINGARSIGLLCEGDQVLCFGNGSELETKAITSIESKSIDTVIEITTADDVVIRVAPEQRFFVSHKWVNAEDLSLNDVLLTQNKSLIRIKSIRHLQEEETFCFIEVEDNHNFFATKNGIVIHNGVGGAAVGFYAGVGLVGGIYGTMTWAVGVASGPAAPFTVGAWTACTAGPALAATKFAGLAGALIGGTITGPV